MMTRAPHNLRPANPHKLWIYPALMVFIFVVSHAGTAMALSFFNGTTMVPCTWTIGITAQVVNCVQQAIISATQRYLQAFSTAIFGSVVAFVTLVVTFFGVQMLFGLSEVTKKAPALLLKIGAVFLFANNLGGFANVVFDIMDEAQVVITNNIPTGSFACDIGLAIAGMFTNDVIWMRMDCLLGRMLGISGDMLFYNGVLALLATTVFSGVIGVMVFFAGLSAIMSMGFFVLNAVTTYLISYLMVAFLIIISPLLIPLLLLGATMNMFTMWLRSMLSAMAQPAMMFAFMAITLPMLDNIIIVDSHSINQVLGEDFLQYMRNQSTPCTFATPTDEDNFDAVQGGGDTWWNDRGEVLSPIMDGATDMCQVMQMAETDFGQEHLDTMMKVAVSLIRILFVAYLISKLQGFVPRLTSMVMGGGFALTSNMSSVMMTSALAPHLSRAKTGMMKAAQSGGSTAQSMAKSVSGLTGAR